MSSTDDINSGGYWFASLTREDNYKSWRLQMCASLFKSDLTDFIDKHIHKLCHLYQDLTIVGFNMPKAKFTSVVLMSLPPLWDSFISMINGEDLESTDPEVSKKAADSILSQFQSEVMHWKLQHISLGPSAFNSQKSTSYSKSRPNKMTTE